MSIELKSTKSFWKLPAAHSQWFATGADRKPGPCATLHGYDRSVHFEFSGRPDKHGWLVGFGDLEVVKDFVEYYLDHVALLGADDPRLDAAFAARDAGILAELRILPHGVSMEMTALFFWTQINPYIAKMTQGRCYISRLEVREHDSNSALFTATPDIAHAQARAARSDQILVKKPVWKFIEPHHMITYINSLETL